MCVGLCCFTCSFCADNAKTHTYITATLTPRLRCRLPPADCPACYDLVQDAVRELRDLLANLTRMIDNIGDDPESIDDADFRSKLRAVNDSVNQLLEDARNAVGESARHR